MAEEKNFENKIKAYIKELGGWYVKYWSGGVPTKQGVRKFTVDGVPDLLCCINGYFVAIEVKSQNGKPSELQLDTIREIKRAWGFAFVVYPSGWEECKKFLWKLNQGYYSRVVLPIIFK